MPPLFFDEPILHFFNQFIAQSPGLDKWLVYFLESHLAKGVVLVLACWYIWYTYPGPQMEKTRNGICTTITSSLIAVFIARIAVHAFPNRPRPFLNSDLKLNIADSLDILAFKDVSSFPSDHATLFIALSYGIWKTNKKIGIACLAYTVFIIIIPRMALGLHYPSDILMGALIGFGTVELGFKFETLKKINKYFLDFTTRKPQIFYPVFFFLTYEIANLFDEIRQLLTFIGHTFKG
jgi:undecaprenyl-diphosphatase